MQDAKINWPDYTIESPELLLWSEDLSSDNIKHKMGVRLERLLLRMGLLFLEKVVLLEEGIDIVVFPNSSGLLARLIYGFLNTFWSLESSGESICEQGGIHTLLRKVR